VTDSAARRGAEATFRAHLAAGELRIQFCLACGKGVHYPRIVCPHCASTDLEFREVQGLGTVYSCTVEHRHAATQGLFTLALVDLDEGVRILTEITSSDPESIRIGQRVRAVIGTRNDIRVILFESCTASAGS
jgi:uncharacterized protein